jgi:group I intron endonuclease
MDILCGVYKITSKATKRFYYGSSANMRKRKKGHLKALSNNRHHNSRLQAVYNSYGLHDLSFTVVKLCSITRARKLEQQYITDNCKNKKMLNIGLGAIGGDNLTNNPNRKTIVAKITKAVQDRMNTMTKAERVEAFGRQGPANGMYGKTHTKEARAKISKNNTGKTIDHSGWVPTSENVANYQKAARLRVAQEDYVNPFTDKVHSKKTLKHLSNLAKARYASGILPGNTRKVKIEGKVYESVSAASRAIGKGKPTIVYRLKSPYWDYIYLD